MNINEEPYAGNPQVRFCEGNKSSHNTLNNLLVGVEMPITEHPLHRSVQAHLMHTALTLGDDAVKSHAFLDRI